MKAHKCIGQIMKTLSRVRVPSYTGNSVEHVRENVFQVSCQGFKTVFIRGLLDQLTEGYAGLASPVQTLFSVSRLTTLTKRRAAF